jgi:hypothetical protein
MHANLTQRFSWYKLWKEPQSKSFRYEKISNGRLHTILRCQLTESVSSRLLPIDGWLDALTNCTGDGQVGRHIYIARLIATERMKLRIHDATGGTTDCIL